MTYSPIDPENRVTGWGVKRPTGWGVWLFLGVCALVATVLVVVLR